MKPGETPPPPTPAEPPPGTGGPNRRLAAEIDAREYRRRRPDLMLLMCGAVVVALVLVQIVRTQLDTPDAAATPEAQRGAAAGDRAAPAAGADTNAAASVMDRVFETALADLKARSASDLEAQRQTAAYRATLAGTIAKAELALDIEAFQCGPRLCMGSVRGDADAYAALHAALASASPLPVYAFTDQPGARERTDGPHRFMFSIEASAGETDAPSPAP
ncbi:hypothetical protein A7A76_14025 [Lysobacter enzymogenes]|uniref:hypothetical protein n=1 Tax=Lysobacter enzymogenes TaxID=69 RepID=UPI0019D01CD1|nr:hypothetical protein [Lysobacter enzymogenes]MBN7135846.1 hypothetical protein [Lysobacter enzymogenes]